MGQTDSRHNSGISDRAICSSTIIAIVADYDQQISHTSDYVVDPRVFISQRVPLDSQEILTSNAWVSIIFKGSHSSALIVVPLTD